MEIRTADAEGLDVERLVSGVGHTGAPWPAPFSRFSWSSNGEFLIFGGVIGPTDEFLGPGHSKLYRVPAAGGTPRAVPGTLGGESPVVSANDRTIAFLRTRGTNGEWRTSGGKHGRTFARTSIWLIGVDGRNGRRLTRWRNSAYEIPSSFSPDGSTLAITRYSGNRGLPQAVALRLDSGAAAVISHDAAEPVHSPDGSRIAFVGMKSPVDRDIYVTNTDGTALTRLTDSRPIEQTPSWDPSGQRLAFLRLSGAGTLAAFSGIGDALLQINADGSCPTKIVSAPEVAYLSPTWQPGPGREAGPIAC